MAHHVCVLVRSPLEQQRNNVSKAYIAIQWRVRTYKGTHVRGKLQLGVDIFEFIQKANQKQGHGKL